MKKLLLASFVVASFIVYSLYERRSGTPVVATPMSLAQNTHPASTGSADSTPSPTSAYKDGQYTGPAEDAYYGYVQVKATISGGKLTNVNFLQFPDEENTSQGINSQAMPYLVQEALQAQSAQVNTISGATNTSDAFIQSLSAALSQAHA